MSYGGYADYCRVPAGFVFKIPEGLPSEAAAPMLCGGITVYAPLKRNGCGPGKKVGIVGFGGLGHMGVLFAKAMGADKVIVVSRSSTKKQDALEMGADEYIATAEEENWAKNHCRTVDLLISTVSSSDMPLEDYLRLLRTHGTFIQVGAPEDNFPAFSAFALIAKAAKIGGSSVGNSEEIEEMLAFAAEKNVKPWIEQRPLKDANRTLVDMEAGQARYRYVLINENNISI